MQMNHGREYDVTMRVKVGDAVMSLTDDVLKGSLTTALTDCETTVDEIHVRQTDHRAEAVKLAEACANFVNSFSCDAKGFAEAMTRQHRTLQQSFTRLVIEFLRAEAKTGTDARNEAAAQAARIMVDAFDEKVGGLPLV